MTHQRSSVALGRDADKDADPDGDVLAWDEEARKAKRVAQALKD